MVNTIKLWKITKYNGKYMKILRKIQGNTMEIVGQRDGEHKENTIENT